MAPHTAPRLDFDRPPSQKVPFVLSLIALALGLIAAALAWFGISGSQFSLLDAYHVTYVYIAQGSTPLQASGPLGALLYTSAASDPTVLLAFAVIVLFWPAMLVSGTVNLITRSYAGYPFAWGLIVFISSYVMMHYGGSTLGTGAYLELFAAVLFLGASLTVRSATSARPRPTRG